MHIKGIPSDLKGKTYEEIYGIQRAKRLKKLLSKVHIGLGNPDLIGKTYEEIYGVNKAKKQRRLLSLAHLGKKLSKKTIKKLRSIKKRLGLRIGHDEKFILDQLEHDLGYKILRQYRVSYDKGNYYIDGYIPNKRLAVEVDERPKKETKELKRQKFIEHKLKCKFLRVRI